MKAKYEQHTRESNNSDVVDTGGVSSSGHHFWPDVKLWRTHTIYMNYKNTKAFVFCLTFSTCTYTM